MQFLYPYVLFGLLALSVPVIIHLFNFKKPKRVYFTNVRFLRELKLESRRRSQLKHLIVMFLRMLAFASLVLAFAMPVLHRRDTEPLQRNPLVVVYLDNSYSMQSQGLRGVLLEDGIKKGLEIAGYYAPSDEFFLITNDFSPRYSRVVNRADFLELLTSVQYSPVSRSAEEILMRVADIRKRYPEHNVVLYFISDFQISTVRMTAAEPDKGLQTYLLPLKSSGASNLYIDSVWMDQPVIRPGQIVDFIIRVGNTGSTDIDEIPVILSLNGKEAAVGSIKAPAAGKATLKLTTRIPAEGIYHGEITLEDHPVVFDDRFFLGIKVTQHRNVLVLNGDKEEPSLNRLFRGDSLFNFESKPALQIDFASIRRYDVIFCNGLKELSTALTEALQRFVTEGGTLVVIPAEGFPNGQPVNALLDALQVVGYGGYDTVDVRLSSVEFDHPVYKGVYSEKPGNLSMPWIYGHYNLSSAGNAGSSVIMKMLNDKPLLLSASSGKGLVYIFTSSLQTSATNLTAHAEIFVPPVYNMALYSGVVPPLFYITGKDVSVMIAYPESITESVFRIRNLEDGDEFIPGHRNEPLGTLLFFEDQISKAGNYQVVIDETEIAPLAFNFAHEESDLRQESGDVLQEWITENGYKHIHIIQVSGKSVTDKLSEMNEGLRLWRFFVMAALLFLIAETVLLRFWNRRAVKTT